MAVHVVIQHQSILDEELNTGYSQMVVPGTQVCLIPYCPVSERPQVFPGIPLVEGDSKFPRMRSLSGLSGHCRMFVKLDYVIGPSDCYRQ